LDMSDNVLKNDSRFEGVTSVTSAIQMSPEEIKQKYQEYLACFNAEDFEGLEKYMAEDLYFFRGRFPPLIGRKSFFKFYKKAWQHLEEHITIHSMEVFERNITVNLTNNLHVFKTWPNCVFGTYNKGLIKELTGYVVYTFDNQGKIVVIVDLD
jgi:ketosteroid isomerase-like protein